MPRNPKPIRSRRKDEVAYEKMLRRMVLDVMFGRLQSKLALAAATEQALAVEAIRAGREVAGEMLANPRGWLRTEEIQRHLDNVEGYHRGRLLATFRSALGVNVQPFLTQPAVAAFMQQKLAENVALVKTIPFHERLQAAIEKQMAKAPFDQKALADMLRNQFRSEGYNLRRLTRDQTQKAVNGLSEIRHRQLGVTEYIWRTSEDERVREEHQANNGRTFQWATPPPITGHTGYDVQCRCLPEPIITPANRQRLGATR